MAVASICSNAGTSNNGPKFSLKKGNLNHRLPFLGFFWDFGPPPSHSVLEKLKPSITVGRKNPCLPPRNTWCSTSIPAREKTLFRRSNVFDRIPSNGQKLAVEGSKINSAVLTLPRLKSYKKSVPPQEFPWAEAVTGTRTRKFQPPPT